MIKTKLIAARKEKNISQTDMAMKLCMSQSQYQRREHGDIRISENEWVRIAKLLNKDIEAIKEEDSINNNQSEYYSASNNHFYNIPEFIVKNQQEYIEMLKEKIKRLQEEINHQQGTI